jgi:hypothetical protein
MTRAPDLDVPCLYMRRATYDDLETLVRWRAETAEEIGRRERELGLPTTGQWATPYAQWKLKRWIDRGVTWMALPDPYLRTLPIATVTLDPEPEPAVELGPGEYEPLWTPDEMATPAWYMSKLNRSPAPELKGMGIGELLVRWCRTRAAIGGAELLRIDVWTGYYPNPADRQNQRLQRWYHDLGFDHVRTVPNVVSGYLMQIRAEVDPEVGQRVREIEEQPSLVSAWMPN